MSEVDKSKSITDKDKELLDSLVQEKKSIDAFRKINAAPIPVSIYRHSSLVEALEIELGELDSALKDAPSEDRKKAIEERQVELTKRLDEQEKDKIEGILTPLTYRDINDIKAAITEAIIHFNDYNFDPEVKMARVLMEERYMTVFCSLKKKNSPKVRYFRTLDEIALVDEDTINLLHKLWENQFVLTEDELKN